MPGALSAAVLAVVYWRLTRAPSGSFVDPVPRRALGVGWGFVPMSLAAFLSLVGAARVRVRRSAAPPAT